MKLAAWRKTQGMTQIQLAKALDCSQSYVSQIERANDPLMPGRPMLERIYELTSGRVEPNDFCNLPQISQRDAA